MKYKIGVGIILVFFATNLLAHSAPETMVPVDGAVLDVVPEKIEIRFDDGMRLTKVEMTHGATQSETLDLGTQSGFETEFLVPLVSMGAGVYQIEWRGLGVDGHPMSGSFSFEVK